MSTEITFVVEQDPDGGFTAHAVGSSIFTQGDNPEQLRENVRDAVRCHFPDEEMRPKIIRLHHSGRASFGPSSDRGRAQGHAPTRSGVRE